MRKVPCSFVFQGVSEVSDGGVGVGVGAGVGVETGVGVGVNVGVGAGVAVGLVAPLTNSISAWPQT